MTAHIILFLPHRSAEADKRQSSDEDWKEEEQESINSTVALCAAIFRQRSVMMRAILSYNMLFLFLCYFCKDTVLINVL